MYLGIDLGTSSIKAVLAGEDGKILDHAAQDYPVYYPQDSWSEQNPEDWYGGLLAVLQELGTRQNLALVQGVSFCGQMHGLVVLDENDAVIRPALLWNDGRTVAQVTQLNRDPGQDVLIARTGNLALTGFTAPKLLWLRENEPENFSKIRKIMLPKDYLLYRMSGVFASDVSDNSGTLYFDTEHKVWSEPMLTRLGIASAQLPCVYESHGAVGTILPAFAALTGLSPAARVIAGGGDQAVGAVGTGTVEANMLSISLGTSGVVFAASDRFTPDPEGRLHCFCDCTGGYHMMGVILSAAASLTWWVEEILGQRDYDKVLGEVDLDVIDELIFHPYLMGERSPINDPAAKGLFYGMTLSKGRKSMTKAVLEGISFALYDCYAVIRAREIAPQFARVIGGGAKSPVLLQILADVLGLELRTIDTSDGGAMGAITLAMVGCGAFPSVAAACQALVHDTHCYFPDPARHAQYLAKFARYKQLYEKLHD